MVTSAIRPSRLLDHALKLANQHSGQGRPSPTWLRRSISASYYALFHKIAGNVAWQVAPTSSDEDRYRLARSVDHGRVADVCGWLRGSGKEGKEQVRPIVARLRQNQGLVDLAGTFVRLQEARHEADYDHLAKIDKSSALAHHQQALSALTMIDGLKGTTDFQEFLALVALHTQLR